MELLGDPQRSAPVIHIAGTNGKSSTARITESCCGRSGLTTGTYLSPHLHTVRERILLDGEPVEQRRFVAAYRTSRRTWAFIDARDPHAPMTAFGVLTAIAFACFADAVDVMIIECGMGGRWDATNVVSPTVDGDRRLVWIIWSTWVLTLPPSRREKAGIITSDAPVVLGRRDREVADVIAATAEQRGRRCSGSVGTSPWRAGRGGRRQLLTIAGLAGSTGTSTCRFTESPSRKRRGGLGCGGTVLRRWHRDAQRGDRPSGFRCGRIAGPAGSAADVAHHRRGRRTQPGWGHCPGRGLPEAFGFDYLVAVVAVFADKDASGILAGLGDAVDEVVVTVNSSPRAMDIDDLAAAA